jgi:hypothetical protein
MKKQLCICVSETAQPINWQSSVGLLWCCESYSLSTTPSIPNYKALQESWRNPKSLGNKDQYKPFPHAFFFGETPRASEIVEQNTRPIKRLGVVSWSIIFLCSPPLSVCWERKPSWAKKGRTNPLVQSVMGGTWLVIFVTSIMQSKWSSISSVWSAVFNN